MLTALALLAGLYLLWELRNIVVWCVVAVFLAVALNPAVDWLDRRGLPRVVAIVLVYLALLLLVVGLFTSPLTAVVFIAYFVVYQQVENHVLQPLVYSRSVAPPSYSGVSGSRGRRGTARDTGGAAGDPRGRDLTHPRGRVVRCPYSADGRARAGRRTGRDS